MLYEVITLLRIAILGIENFIGIKFMISQPLTHRRIAGVINFIQIINIIATLAQVSLQVQPAYFRIVLDCFGVILFLFEPLPGSFFV